MRDGHFVLADDYSLRRALPLQQGVHCLQDRPSGAKRVRRVCVVDSPLWSRTLRMPVSGGKLPLDGTTWKKSGACRYCC
jgi:hypothetical protein